MQLLSVHDDDCEWVWEVKDSALGQVIRANDYGGREVET